MARARVGRVTLLLAQFAFSLVLSWRLSTLAWYWDFAVAAAVTFLIDLVLRRSKTAVQTFIQLKRRSVTVLAIGGVAIAALTVSAATGADLHLSLHALLKPNDVFVFVMALLMGHAIRRTAGRAISPDCTESAARRPKAYFFLILTFAVGAIPSWSWLSLVLYLFGIAGGITAHWVLREVEYFEADRARRVAVISSLSDRLTDTEWSAFKLLERGRLDSAKALVENDPALPSQLISAVAEFEKREFGQARWRLKRLSPPTSASEKAKILALSARISHALGDENEMLEQLRDAQRLDDSCAVVTVALGTLTSAGRHAHAAPEQELLRILQVAGQARGPLRSIDAHLVNRAFDVDSAFFYDAFGLTLLHMGQHRYAEDVIARAVQLAPRNPLARLHQGMIFAERMVTCSACERAELADVARIALKLAIDLSPPSSLTATTARRYLAQLDADPGSRRPSSPAPSPLRADRDKDERAAS